METEISIGAMRPEGCLAGVIMPDGTIVVCEGEPEPAKAGNWHKPYDADNQ